MVSMMHVLERLWTLVRNEPSFIVINENYDRDSGERTITIHFCGAYRPAGVRKEIEDLVISYLERAATGIEKYSVSSYTYRKEGEVAVRIREGASKHALAYRSPHIIREIKGRFPSSRIFCDVRTDAQQSDAF